jgi:uncharacterized membrane protein YbhN (UPF0104 family)
LTPPVPLAPHVPPAPPVPRPFVRRVWPLVHSLVGVGILVALAAHLGAAPFIQGLRAVGVWSMLAALGIGVATTLFSAWRWCLVARALGLRLPAAKAVAECYRALFLNSVLPAGVLGDVNRAVSHGRRAGDLGRSIRAVVLERMAGQVVLMVFAAVVLIAHPSVLVAIYNLVPRSGVTGGIALVAGILAGMVIAAVVALTVRRSRRARMAGEEPMPAPAATAAIGTTRRPRAAVLRSRLGTWAAVAVLSSAALFGYLAMFVIAARAAGSQAQIRDLLPVLVLALLAMGLPVSIGGWGPREAVTTAAFAAVGFGAAQGLTVAVVYGALSFIACLPGAGVLLVGLRRPKMNVEGSPAVQGPNPDLPRIA